MTRSLRSFARDASHNRLLAVPALLYAVNNYLKFVMQLYFKPTTAKMLGNSKILVIAVLMRSVLRRSFTLFQWEALYLLVAGITVNQLHTCGGGAGAGALDSITPAAVAFTAASITVPSLASVYNEAALKRHMDTSVLLQNFFLYFYGACFNVVGLVVVAALQGAGAASLWSGFGMASGAGLRGARGGAVLSHDGQRWGRLGAVNGFGAGPACRRSGMSMTAEQGSPWVSHDLHGAHAWAGLRPLSAAVQQPLAISPPPQHPSSPPTHT